MAKNPPASAGDRGDKGLIPGSGRSPGAGNGNSLQYTCLKNYTDRGAWWATVPGVADSDTTDSMCVHTHTHFNIAEFFFFRTFYFVLSF